MIARLKVSTFCESIGKFLPNVEQTEVVLGVMMKKVRLQRAGAARTIGQ
jgi:hypothetical protein